MRRRAFLLCGDWYEADDLVQQTLIKLFRRGQSSDRRDELFGYARSVMVRAFISDHRSVVGSPELLLQPGEREQRPGRPPLLDALARLGHRQRAMIVLRYGEHLTVQETAEILGYSPATVRSQTFHALAILRAFLQHELSPKTADLKPDTSDE